MGQRRRRSSGENFNRNERNIKNTREVSRRTKGKNRYAYENEYNETRNRGSRKYAGYGYPEMDEEQQYSECCCKCEQINCDHHIHTAECINH